MGKFTIKEHYISQMILKRHLAPLLIPETQRYIYYYDKYNKIERKVRIKDICKKKNLYELKDKNENIVERNSIEKSLSILENFWSVILDKIEEEKCLTDEEISSLYALIALQILRMPEVISLSTNFVKENYEDIICKYLPNCTIESYVKMASLPYGKVTEEGTWMLTKILESFEDFNLVVYKSKYPFILNTNRPILCVRIFNISKFFDFMVFPMSSYFAIALIKRKSNKFYFNVSDNFVKYINKLNFESESRYVICSKSIKGLNDFENIIV